jgi:outer membrane scaffolding protein for murein synthesis (MipA/OmpV family)
MAKWQCVFAMLLISASGLSAAQDDTQSEQSHFYWEGDLGFAALYRDNVLIDDLEPVEDGVNGLILFTGGVYFKHFYVEFTPLANHPLTFGYTLTQSDEQQINLIAESWFSSIKAEDQFNTNRLDTIEDRDASLELGIEYLRTYDGYDIRSRFLTDALSKHSGHLFSVEVSRAFFTSTTLFVPTLGFTYISEQAIDYYYGVSPAETSAQLLTYQGEQAVVASARIYIERPISETWSAIGFANYHHLPDSIKDSPIITADGGSYAIGLGVLWTF